MRSIAFVTLFALSSLALAVVLGAPTGTQAPLCPSIPVQLELRTSPTQENRYQLVFASVDPHEQQNADFVDIHWRVNNDDSVNMRVLTQGLLGSSGMRTNHAQIDNINLNPGDTLRAYATYSAKGYACDTPVHTFSAPEQQQDVALKFRGINSRSDILNQNINFAPHSRVRAHPIDTEEFWTQAVIEQNNILGHETPGACPSIASEQDIWKIAGLRDTYMLSFENKNPKKQLHYVDLHLSTSEENGWDNLRLASDMQLNMAHRVMQPGVVIRPEEALKYYWSYRVHDADGKIVDCTTPLSVITPNQVSHEITIQQIQAAARS